MSPTFLEYNSAMKKLVWIVGATLAIPILFGSGFLAGREFPAHHWEKAAAGYLYDSSTGHVCAIFPDSLSSSQGISSPTGSAPSKFPAWVSEAWKQKPIPLCNSK